MRAYDPVAEAEAEAVGGADFVSSAEAAVEGADAVVLVTEWPEFRGLDLGAVAESMRGALLTDGRNFLDPDAATTAGLIYEAWGARASAAPRAAEAAV